MPKPEKPEDITLNGKTATKLVKAVKPAREGHPNIVGEMVALAAAKKAKKAQEAQKSG